MAPWSEYQELLSQCLEKYNGERESVNVDAAHLRDYAEYMLKHIDKALQA